jgi:hypothetical protein
MSSLVADDGDPGDILTCLQIARGVASVYTTSIEDEERDHVATPYTVNTVR